jgi:hypothetical protein
MLWGFGQWLVFLAQHLEEVVLEAREGTSPAEDAIDPISD